MNKHFRTMGIVMILLLFTLSACQGFMRIRETDGGFDIDLNAEGDPNLIPPTGGDIIVQQQQQDGMTSNEFLQSNWILILGFLLVFVIVIVALTRRDGDAHAPKE